MDVLGFEERGIQRLWVERHWIPAFAGMTNKSFPRLKILKFGALTPTLPYCRREGAGCGKCRDNRFASAIGVNDGGERFS
ncbi:hypothetical protein [Dyella sp.]|uniref:hypothetical protein n=1 Tax=Dyella sp. TaxID=1869338 RepID=UPI002B489DC3|nr:hypothetical protein [Dyella sp.]HKT27686.1 hypothetical protein [Dyella sp.]